jgi:hypothetical protein
MATQPSFMNRLKQFNPFTRKNNGSTASSSFFNYFRRKNKPSFLNRIFKKNKVQNTTNNYRTRYWMRPRAASVNLNNNSGKAPPSWWNKINPFKTTVKKRNASTWNGRFFAKPPAPPPSENELQVRKWHAQQVGYNMNANRNFEYNSNSTDYESPRRNNHYDSLGGRRTRKSRR